MKVSYKVLPERDDNDFITLCDGPPTIVSFPVSLILHATSDGKFVSVIITPDEFDNIIEKMEKIKAHRARYSLD